MREGSMSPRLIKGADFADTLMNAQKNKADTAEFLRNGVKAFDLPEYVLPYGYRLLRSQDGEQIRLIAGDETAYYVKLRFEDGKSVYYPALQHVTQAAVWRSDDECHEAAVTVARFAKLVFNWLISQYTVVVSDTEQTLLGAGFWQRRIRQAIARSDQHVYLWDGTQEDAEPVEITDVNQFNEVWVGFAWGEDRETHKYRLFVITSQPLQAAQ